MESILAAKAAPTAKATISGLEVKAASKSGIEGKAASKITSSGKPSVLAKAAASKANSTGGFSQSVHSVGKTSVAKVTCQQCNIPISKASTNTVSSKFGQDVHTVNSGDTDPGYYRNCGAYCTDKPIPPRK